MKENGFLVKIISSIVMVFSAILFIIPIVFLFINSFKGQSFIEKSFFSVPDLESFVGFGNYFEALIETDFLFSLIISIFITAISVWFIMFVSSMAAWMISAAKNIFSKILFFFFLFCLAVPFETMMFIFPQMLRYLDLNNPLGIIFINIGFAIPFNIFVYSLFAGLIPANIEKAAFLEGCSPIRIFFEIISPILRPVTLALALINTVWLWNDFLISGSVLGTASYKTLPLFIADLGLYQSSKPGVFIAVLVLSLIPIFVFYKRFNSRIVRKIEDTIKTGE
ncbi:MAG: ABC transporter permease subunit [Elusimicrobiota bacterium]|jgi:raffinose/stachyose/melibiose transport system permease protein|nr:ABC transporter permease subunit [Elusimicrobiota bacterium]